MSDKAERMISDLQREPADMFHGDVTCDLGGMPISNVVRYQTPGKDGHAQVVLNNRHSLNNSFFQDCDVFVYLCDVGEPEAIWMANRVTGCGFKRSNINVYDVDGVWRGGSGERLTAPKTQEGGTDDA